MELVEQMVALIIENGSPAYQIFFLIGIMILTFALCFYPGTLAVKKKHPKQDSIQYANIALLALFIVSVTSNAIDSTLGLILFSISILGLWIYTVFTGNGKPSNDP